MATYGCSTCPLTLLYKLWMDMFLWGTKTCGCVQACVCHWTLSVCDQNSFCVYLSRACVRYFHSMTYAWKTHMSASAGICEWHMNTVFTTCLNLYIEGKPVCGSSNPHQAAALVRIQPQGTSRPTCWLGIREREKEDRVKWYRAGMRDKEKEKGPLSFSKEFVNVYNPIKQGEQLDPSHNMH